MTTLLAAIALNYYNAVEAKNNNFIRVWGEMLITTQRETGIELHEERTIRIQIDHATA